MIPLKIRDNKIQNSRKQSVKLAAFIIEAAQNSLTKLEMEFTWKFGVHPEAKSVYR